eukprot:2640198-Karenia_brevis.AAC.1
MDFTGAAVASQVELKILCLPSRRFDCTRCPICCRLGLVPANEQSSFLSLLPRSHLLKLRRSP